MKNIFTRFADKYFGDHLDFRARIFNVTLSVGFLMGMIAPPATILLARGETPAGFPALIAPITSAFLVWYANRSGRFELCYWISTILTRMLLVIVAFFLNGGYKGGAMLLYFALNVVVTSMIFSGKKAIIVPLILFAEYIALCVFAYYNPHTIRFFGGEREQFLAIVLALVTVCLSLSAIMILHLRIHAKQKLELEKARRAEVEYEKLKTDFFTQINHEYRTPLVAISTCANVAQSQVSKLKTEYQNIRDELSASLQIINTDAKRLAGMTRYTLKTLSMPFEISRTGGGHNTI